MTERDERDGARLLRDIERLIDGRPELTVIGGATSTEDTRVATPSPPSTPLRSWDHLVDSIVEIICELNEHVDGLDEVEALEMAHAVGPLGISIQLFARRLLRHRRPKAELQPRG
jgi:hypothetical protein